MSDSFGCIKGWHYFAKRGEVGKLLVTNYVELIHIGK